MIKFKKYFHNKNKIIPNYIRSNKVFESFNIYNLIKLIESKFESWMNWNNFNNINLELYNSEDSNTWSWNIYFKQKHNNLNDLWSSNNIILKRSNSKSIKGVFNAKLFYKDRFWYYHKTKNFNEENIKYIIDNQDIKYYYLSKYTKLKKSSIKCFIDLNKTEQAKFLYEKRLNRKKNYIKIAYYRNKTKPDFFIREAVSKRIANTLRKISKKKNSKMSKYLPYTMQELKRHLESLFEPWMTWENYGKYNKNWDDNDQSTWTWQIDHIKPHSMFNYSSVYDDSFKECWNLNNLRPYSAKLNIMDGSKRTRHV
jgi:hypothetical protein